MMFALAAIILAAVVAAQDCTLLIPPNPLTAAGLSTPYVMTGCNLEFATQGCFVEAVILDIATGAFDIYHPLVINEGMVPVGSASSNAAGFYVPPIVPSVPTNAVVGIWFGSNAHSIALTGNSIDLVNAQCYDGYTDKQLGFTLFGQFAYCNAANFFSAGLSTVNAYANARGVQPIPAPGTGVSGQACPTVRDFRIVDQDQSDNVDTTYLLINGNTLAQNTPANAQANPAAEELTNASDNSLLNSFISPALGCKPFTGPCSTCPSGRGSALVLNEFQGQYFPPVGGPALVPLNDDFAYININGVITESLGKVNQYRLGVGQPLASTVANASGTTYCQQFAQSGIFINQNEQLFSGIASPAPADATNLYTFLAMRFSMSFGPVPFLGCTTIFDVANPVGLTTDGNGVVTAATINAGVLQEIFNGQLGPMGQPDVVHSCARSSSLLVDVSLILSLTRREACGME